MVQNRSLQGAAEVVDKAKSDASAGVDNAGAALDWARNTAENAADSVRQMAEEGFDVVGDAFRAAEDFAQREPFKAMAVGAAIGLVAGYVLGLRSGRFDRGTFDWR